MLELSPVHIRVVEVGPRDGLQNEKKIIPLEDKIYFIANLAQAGLKTIEVTSFVRADRIAQMGDAGELFPKVAKSAWSKNLNMPCLVPNLKGLENAYQAGVKEIAVFSASSESFNKKNINATIDESLKRIEALSLKAKDYGLKQRGYVSTVFGCPYEGETSIDSLKYVCENLFKFGVYEISLGDTIGIADPIQVQNILKELKKDFDLSKFSMHFHDTRGRALANILASLDMGLQSFDASAAGLGGCPYAPGATGNVATEDVVSLLHRMGYSTGIDFSKLCEASTKILRMLEKPSASKARNAYLAKCELEAKG